MLIETGGGAVDGGSEFSGGSVDPVGLGGLLDFAGVLAQPAAATPAPRRAATTRILRTIR
jgi:hypothetical protein